MKVNYKSDFELTIQLTAGGVDVAAPLWDWQLRFYTFDRQAVYTVAYIDGKAERCAVNTDGTITAYFDKHGLMPGALRCEFVNLVPDSHYTHDTQMQVDPVELGVELWRGASDGGMDAVTLELAGQVLAEVQALAADLQQKAESGYFDGEPGPQGPQGPPGPAGPGLLVVAVTGSDQETLTADHTAGEILAAHEAGRPVVATYDGEVYQLASVGSSLASFSLASADLDVLAQIDVHEDGGASRIFDEVQGALTAGDGIVIDGATISAEREIFWIDIKEQSSGYVYADGFDPASIKTAHDAGKRLVVRQQRVGPAPQYETYCDYFEIFSYYGQWRAMMPIYNPPTNIAGWRVLLLDSTGISSYRVLYDSTPTANSVFPITSGGVFTALQSKADVAALRDYCPIIEDTRTGVGAAITGNAPFNQLVDGQRIVLHLNNNAIGSCKLNLTLSDNTTTGEKFIKVRLNSVFAILGTAYVCNTNDYLPLVYNAYENSWLMLGHEKNTTYTAITQAEITAGSSTSTRLVTPKLLVDNFERRRTYVDNSADASVELSVATYNDLGSLSSWKPVTLPAAYNRGDEFIFRFECGDADLSPVLPAGVVMADGFDFSEMAVDLVYQVSIMDGVAAYLTITPNN